MSLGAGSATAGSSITGSGHNGLVVVNNSSVAVALGTNVPATEISGSAAYPGSNAKDLFCDSSSLITGAAKITHDSAKVQCAQLLSGTFEPIPW